MSHANKRALVIVHIHKLENHYHVAVCLLNESVTLEVIHCDQVVTNGNFSVVYTYYEYKPLK
jgi:hypothetical protein